MHNLKQRLIKGEDPNIQAQELEKKLKSFVGRQLQMVVLVEGEEEVMLGTVVELTKLVNRRGRNSILEGAKFKVKVDHKVVEEGIRIYEEELSDDAEKLREAEIDWMLGNCQEAELEIEGEDHIHTDSSNRHDPCG